MFKYCYAYRKLQNVGTVLTIHNAQYQGQTGMDKTVYIPEWDVWKRGLLEWEGALNPLACGIRCAWKVTTVSPTYLQEMRYSSMGLEPCWNMKRASAAASSTGSTPKSGTRQPIDISSTTILPIPWRKANKRNKEALCFQYGLDPRKPLITFIGRLVGG